MTKQELTILAILSETERYGYEINSIINDRYMRLWGDFALSSIYAILEKLQKGNYIDSRVIQQVGRPPRRLYRITSYGSDILMNAIESILLLENGLLGRFDLVLLVWPNLSDSRRKEIINKYLEHLNDRSRLFAQKIDSEINPVSQAMFSRPLRIIEAEISWLKSFAERNNIDFIN